MSAAEQEEAGRIRVTEDQLHYHLRTRMQQRGVTREEIESTLNDGREAADAKPGTSGTSLVFRYEAEWEGEFHREKEVTVYHKRAGTGIILLTVKARYGQGFARS